MQALPLVQAGRQRAEDKARGKQPGRQGQLSLPEGSGSQASRQCSALSPMLCQPPPDARHRVSKRSAQI